MALYLAQHGKSLSKDVDPDQGLSDEGKADVRRIADVASGYGVTVSRIAHSGKKRGIYALAVNQLSIVGELVQKEYWIETSLTQFVQQDFPVPESKSVGAL